MYQNKCSKCGEEFETKNPKRVICPSCLYPDKKPISLKPYEEVINSKNETEPQVSPEDQRSNYTNQNNYGSQHRYSGDYNQRPQQGNFQRQQQNGNYQGGGYRPQGQGNFQRNQQDGNYQGGGYRPQGQDNFQRPPQGGGYRPQGQGNFQRPPQSGGYRPQGQGNFQRPPQGGGYRPQGQGNFQRPQQGGFRRPGGRPPQRGGPRGPKKPLLISKEQVANIEKLYMPLLPLPNPDVHEIIAQEINEDPKKVFFGINLIRQKLMLPKVQFTKRKIVVSPEQLKAIETLYAPLLPLPPIGCHKFISKQLKMDEWRVHVGIGIIRKQMELPRWNPDREDAPEEFKKQRQEELAAQAETPKAEEKAPE